MLDLGQRVLAALCGTHRAALGKLSEQLAAALANGAAQSESDYVSPSWLEPTIQRVNSQVAICVSRF